MNEGDRWLERVFTARDREELAQAYDAWATRYGYRDLTAVDMSEGMLAAARARGAYRRLERAVLGERLPFADASFAAVVSTGVFTRGHAPAAAFDELVRVTRPGGPLVFTVGSSAWEEGGYRARAEALEQAGRWQRAAATEPYRPMPLSPAEGAFTTQCYVYRAAAPASA